MCDVQAGPSFSRMNADYYEVQWFFSSSPRWPLRVSSQPQLSKSPRLQFLVRVYITPAELMAWTNAVSRFAGNRHDITLS